MNVDPMEDTNGPRSSKPQEAKPRPPQSEIHRPDHHVALLLFQAVPSRHSPECFGRFGSCSGAGPSDSFLRFS